MSRRSLLFASQATLLKALAHPARLAVLNILRDHALSVQEMQDMTALPQATLSQHLQVLRNEQVVMAVRNGKRIKYQLTHPAFLHAVDALGDLVQQRLTSGNARSKRRQLTSIAAAKTVDPVCGMSLFPATAPYAKSYKGTMMYFCGRGCLQRFEHAPARFLINNSHDKE